MSRTRRTLTWARCPKPDCPDGRVYLTDDNEVEDNDCGCPEYTDAEYDTIIRNLNYGDTDSSVWGDLARDTR